MRSQKINLHLIQSILTISFASAVMAENVSDSATNDYSDYPAYYDDAPDYETYMSGGPFNISGVAASPVDGRYWMVDNKGNPTPQPLSGCKAILQADRSSGGLVRTFHRFKTTSTTYTGGYDFEDIAVADDSLSSTGSTIFIGDIGDGGRNKSKRAIYLFDEPAAANNASDCSVAQTGKYFVYQYFNGDTPPVQVKLDSESMFVDPNTLDIYLIAKSYSTSFNYRRVFKIEREAYLQHLYPTGGAPATTATANFIGNIYTPYNERRQLRPFTGASMDRSGKFLIVATYNEAYIWNLQGRSVDEILTPSNMPVETFNSVMPLIWNEGIESIEGIAFSKDMEKIIVVEEGRDFGEGNRYFEHPLINSKPIANVDNLSLAPGSSITFSPLSNDTDADNDPLVIVNVGTASIGTLTDNGNGSYTYSAPSGYTGSVSIPYTIGDEHGLAGGVSPYYYYASSSIEIDIGSVHANADLFIQPEYLILHNWIHFGETYQRSMIIENLSGDEVNSPVVNLSWVNKELLENIEYRYGDNTTFTPLTDDTVVLSDVNLVAGASTIFELRYTVSPEDKNTPQDKSIPVSYTFTVGGDFTETDPSNNTFRLDYFIINN